MSFTEQHLYGDTEVKFIFDRATFRPLRCCYHRQTIDRLKLSVLVFISRDRVGDLVVPRPKRVRAATCYRWNQARPGRCRR